MPARAARLWVRRQPAGAPIVHSDAGAGGPAVGQETAAKADGLRLDLAAAATNCAHNARNNTVSGALGGISSQSDQTGNQFS